MAPLVFQSSGRSGSEKIKTATEQALALAPELAEGHIALGLYYYLGEAAIRQALGEFQRALELQPNNVRALNYSAHVHRRQGQWKRHLSELTRCEQLDPRDASVPAEIGASYCRLRMWEEAKRAGSRSLALDRTTCPQCLIWSLVASTERATSERPCESLARFRPIH